MRVLNFIWRFPLRIMFSGVSLLNLESTTTTGTMQRRRPLQTCGASCLVITQKACTKVQDLDGPLGSIAKSSVTIFNSLYPFIYNTMLYQWVAMLSMIDDSILKVESKIESIFPQSTCVFDKIDKLVSNAEILPEHLDEVLQKFHQFPLLDWILVHLISWLNFILSILTHCGSKNTREKDITVDVSSSNDEKASNSPAKTDPARNHTETQRSVQFEETEKSSYPCNENAIKNNQESSKAVASEVIHLSVKRLHSWKTRIKALEEPVYAGDSPMYSSYQSATSSPVSDCSSVDERDEAYSCSQLGKGHSLNCSYKEALERGTKEDEEDINDDEENDEVIASNNEHVVDGD